MKNVKMSIKGDILTIEVNLKDRHGPSASGKTITIASTEGNVGVGKDDIKIGLNVYTKEGINKE